MSDINRPLLGEPSQPCRTCGAPLAADQRYCLQCGTRRADARLPFLEILAQQVPRTAAAAQVTTTTTTARGPRGLFSRMSTNAAAVAGVACLVLALGVGVLIGNSGGDGTSAASPQIITVGGAAPAAAPAAAAVAPAATTAAPADTATTPGSSGKRGATSRSSKKDTSSSSASSKAAKTALKNLDKTSGTDYSKKSAKLPKQLGTGGKAPPKDTSGKAIGGGSDVETLG
ncbi:MAG TPA: hypothetical protein VI318_04315 [Baekduia sp.]